MWNSFIFPSIVTKDLSKSSRFSIVAYDKQKNRVKFG